MPVPLTLARMMSNEVLVPGLFENAERRIEFSDCFPFFDVNGDAIRIERSQASDFGGEPTFDVVPSTPGEGLAVPTSSLEAKSELKMMVQDVIVEETAALNQSAVEDQIRIQIAAAIKRMIYLLWKTFWIGDESMNPAEPTGARKATPAGQTITAFDTVNYYLDLNDVARALHLIRGNDGWPCVLVMGPLAFRNFLYAHYSRGMRVEIDADWSCRNWFGVTQWRAAQGPRVLFQGIPVFIDDTAPVNETVGSFNDGTSIYAFTCGREGVYGILPRSRKGRMIQVRELVSSSVNRRVFRITLYYSIVFSRQDATARLIIRAVPATQ